jgi:probable phosphoglycerate mutase
MVRRIYLIRHARTVWNDERRIQGWADIEPYEEAKRIFLDKVRAIKDKPSAIFTSDLKRAITSAQLIREIYPETPIFIDWRLRERNMGDLEGLFYVDIRDKYPELWGSVEVRAPGGESVFDMAERLKMSIEDILWFSQKNDYKVIFVVSHQLAIEVTRRLLLGEPIDGGIWENLIGSGDHILINLEENSHLLSRQFRT